MSGLLLKDFYIVRSGLFLLIALLFFIGTGMAIVVDPWIFITMATVMLSTQTNTTIGNDKMSNWNLFSSALPLSKEMIVSSKYFLNLLLSILGICMGAIVSTTVSILLNRFDLTMLVVHIFVAIFIAFVPASINIPLSILLDATKQIIGMLLSYAFVIIINIVTTVIASHYIDVGENMTMLFSILALVSIIIYLLAWFIVPKLLSKREW